MDLIVQKFGGTSVGTPERIQAVAKRVAYERSRGLGVLVVVSAMGQTTDRLMSLASQVSKNPPRREMDMLLSTGERVSMALLSMALGDLGVESVSFTGSQTGIVTDGNHQRARIRQILGHRVRDALNRGQVAIVAGFRGVSEEKEITTLGRGGSDTTAVALAAAFGAQSCDIFTDVDGFFSADPRIVPGARHWPKLSIALAYELACWGATVLHPRSIVLAAKYGVPVRVRGCFTENDRGTEIVMETSERVVVAGVSADPEKVLWEGELSRQGALFTFWDIIREQGFEILNPVGLGRRFWFFGSRESTADWLSLLRKLQQDGFISNFENREDLIPLSIVGDGLGQDSALVCEAMEILRDIVSSLEFWTVTPQALVSAVPVNKSQETVRALHARFVENVAVH